MSQRKNMKGKKLKQFNFIRQLGDGSFGTVYEAIHQKTKQIVAIKVISKSQMNETPKLKELVSSQISILKQVENDNVIKFIDSFSSDKSVFIATQFCNGGDLDEYLKSNGKFNQSQAVTFLKQILNGFKGLHETNTIHRDFKLANVLLHNKMCKIADLGFAKQIKNNGLAKTVLGTDQTMAPQVHLNQEYGMQADIWSLGVVFYQMLYGKVPFSGSNDFIILKNIQTTKPKFQGATVTEQSIDFIKRCLVVDPKDRITWKQIYEHPLLYKSDITLTSVVLRSRLTVSDHKTYYEKNETKNKKTLKQSQKQLIQNGANKQKQIFNNAGDIKQADVQKMQKIKKNKQQLQNTFNQYQADIVNSRNDKMLGITFILPLEKCLQSLKNINHSRPLYQICKKTFIQLKKLKGQITYENHCYKLSYDKKCWNQFKNQQVYKNICHQLTDDCIFAECLAIGYLADLRQQQPNLIENVNRPSQNQIVQKQLKKYETALVHQAKNQNSKDLEKYVKMLKAIEYINQNSQPNFIKFNKDINQMDSKVQLKRLVQKY